MTIVTNPFLRAFDANGNPVSGGKLLAYVAGTTTPAVTYSDVDLTSAQPYPVLSNADGEFPQPYVAPGVYKFVVTDAADVILYEVDNWRISSRPDDPITYDSIVDLQNSTNSYDDDTLIVVLQPHSVYEAVASSATDHDFITAGGEKMRRTTGRTTAVATLLAQSPNGTIVEMDGLLYQRTPAAGDASATFDLGVENLVEHANIAPGHFNSSAVRSRSPSVIRVEDMRGTDDESKLRFALDRAIPGDTVLCHAGFSADIPTEMDPIKSDVAIDGAGGKITAAATMDYIIRGEDGGTGHSIRNMEIDCNSNNAQAGVHRGGGCGFVVEDCEIYHFTARAIDFASRSGDLTDPFKDGQIRRVKLHSPQAGVGHPIMMRSGIGGALPENCIVENNDMWGTDPYDRSLADYTVSNEFTADYVVAQGVKGLILRDNAVRYSGSSGYTIARGCSDIIVQGNTADRCYEPGFNFGSGYEMFHLADITGFVQQSSSGYTWAASGIYSAPDQADLRGTSSTGNRPTAIIPDDVGNGGWICLESAIGGVPQVGDVISQNISGTASSVVSVAPLTNTFGPGRATIHPFQDGLVVNNLSIDTYIQNVSTVAAFNTIRCRGDNVAYGNSAGNPREVGFANNLWSSSNSIWGVSGNFWRGDIAKQEQYTVSGPDGSYLFTRPDAGIETFARAAVSSTGNALSDTGGIPAVVGLSVSLTSTGVYQYTFTNAIDSDRYHVSIAVGSSVYQAAEDSKTTTGFVVRTRRDDTGVAANVSHSVSVTL